MSALLIHKMVSKKTKGHVCSLDCKSFNQTLVDFLCVQHAVIAVYTITACGTVLLCSFFIPEFYTLVTEMVSNRRGLFFLLI